MRMAEGAVGYGERYPRLRRVRVHVISLEDRNHLRQNLVHHCIRQDLHQPAIPGVDVQNAGLIAPYDDGRSPFYFLSMMQENRK